MTALHKWIVAAAILTALVIFFWPDKLAKKGGETPQDEAPLDHGRVQRPPNKNGTDPHRYFLPEKAIDSRRIPNVVLKAEEDADDPLPYYSLSVDTYLFFGNIAEVDRNNRGWNGNAGFVVTRDSVVVIDALGTPKLGERMIATIRTVTEKPITHLILTHNHPDHSYGAIAFRRLGGVKVIAHEGMLDYIGSQEMQQSVAYRRELLPEDMDGFQPVSPDVLVGGPLYSKITIHVGGQRFDIYNTGKHHSAGDLVVDQVDEGIVWISDLAFNQRMTFMGDGSSKLAIQGEDWLLKNFASARIMVPGHGSAQTAPFPMVTRTREYIQHLRDVMAKAVEDGVGLQEAVDEAEFPQWKNTRLYDLNNRANANFVYREMEQELF